MDIKGQEELYKLLNTKKLYTKSFDEFKTQFAKPESQINLHKVLVEKGVYDKPQKDFTNQFFVAEKKNPIQTGGTEEVTVSQQPLAKPKSSSAGGMLQMATPSESESPRPKAGESQGKLLIPEKKTALPSLKKYDVTAPQWFNPNKPIKIDVPTVTKNVAIASKELAQQSKILNQNKAQLDAEIKSFEDTYKANPKNPNLNQLKQQLDKKVEAHNALSNKFQLDINNVNRDRADIKRAAVEEFIDSKDKGNFLGATWNSIVEGYKKIGEAQSRVAIDFGIELMDRVGLPWADPKVVAKTGMTKDEAKKEVISQMMPVISKGYDVAKSKGTTEAYIQQQKASGVLPKAWFGVAESLPVMASGPGLGGTIPRFVSGASLAYQYANDELDSNPNTVNMDENERKKITVPIAVVGGVLEELGFRTLIGKNKPALVKLSNYIIRQLPKNATIETIKEVASLAVKGPIMKQIVSSGGKLATAYLGEAETGGSQRALDYATKEIYDAANNVDLFKNPELLSAQFRDQIIEDANIEGLGGVIMRAIGIGSTAAMRVSGVGQMSDKEYNDWKAMMSLNNSSQLYLSKVIADLSTGRITKDEAAKRVSDYERSKKILDQIPNDLPIADQKKAFAILLENIDLQNSIADLNKYIAGKNPNLVTNINKQIEGLQKRIEDNNNQLTKLSENAVQEQTTSEVPIQPEAGASVQVAEGEPQAEPQVSTEETQVEEVTPTGGGMVQMAPIEEPTAEEPVVEQPITEEPTAEQPVTEEAPKEQPTKLSTNQKSAVQEGIKRALDMVKRYPKQDDVLTKYKALRDFKKINQEYINANQSQKDEMIRQMNIELGLAPNAKAPGVEKLGLKPKAQKVVVNTMTVLKERLKEIDKSIKEGQRNVKQAVEDMSNDIKAMLPKGVFSTSQVKVVANALASNLLNPKLRQAAIDRVSRMANNVAEATKLKMAYDIRSKINSIDKKKIPSAELVDIATGFGRIDPKHVEDLDKHIEEAEKIFNAIKNIKVTKDSKTGEIKIDPRSVLNYQSAQDYTQEQLDKQDEITKEALLDQYKNLVDEGKIDSSMSLNQILSYVKSLEDNSENSDDEKNEALKEFAQQSFNESKDILESDLKNGLINPEVAPLISAFIGIDLSVLDPLSAYEAAYALMNFRENGSTSKMGKIAADFTGAMNSKIISENINRNGKVEVGGNRIKAYKAAGKVIDTLAKIFTLGKANTRLSEKFGKLYSDAWFKYNAPIDNLGTTYFGPNNWKIIKEAAGIDKIAQGVIDRKKIIADFSKEINDKYKNAKIGNDNVFTARVATMLDVIANLYRQTSNSKQKDTYFDDRKKILKQTIDYLNSSEDEDDQKQGKLLEEIYNELGIENATSGQEVFDNADPVARNIINDFINKFKEYYPEFAQVAQDQFNIILGQDNNYTADTWRNVGQTEKSSSDKLFKKGRFTTGHDIIETEESGNFVKPTYPKKLPTKNNKIVKIASYDFFKNQMNALAETINTTKTIAGANQYASFMDSPYFEKIITDDASRKLFKDRMDYNVSLYQMNEKIGPRDNSRAVAEALSWPMRQGAKVGLSSAESIFTQSIPILTNTIVNLKNPGYLITAAEYLEDKDMRNFLNNLKYGITQRGGAAQTNIDYADNMLERGDYSTTAKTLETLKSATNFLVEKGLVGTDVLTAKITWMAYYMDNLAQQGVDPVKVDWKNHEVNDEAAKYAESMVQREQNINLPESGGKLWSSKDPQMKLARMAFPFASFTTSQKDKIKTNMAVLFMDNNLATKEEKIAAAKSIVGSAAEQYMFNFIKAKIASGITMGAYNVVKKKETKEEEQLREKKKTNRLIEDLYETFSGSNTIFEKEADAVIGNLVMRSMGVIYDLVDNAIENKLTSEQILNEIEKIKWESFVSDEVEKENKSRSDLYDTPLAKSQNKLKAEKLKKEIEKPFRLRKAPEGGAFEKGFEMIGGVPQAAYNAWIKVITEGVIPIAKAATPTEDGGEAKFSTDDVNKLLTLLPFKFLGSIGGGREFRKLYDESYKIIKESAEMRYKKRKAGRKRMEAEMNGQ